MSFLESGIESLIFCSPKPIKIKEIIKVFEEAEKKNYDENKIKNCSFICGDMKVILNEDFIKSNCKPDIIITDPPREGMHKKVISQIMNVKPEKIVYISCNSATQARDIAILKSNTKPDLIFPVSNEDVSLLEDVIVAGFPLGKQISSAIKTHKGVVTALAGAGDNYSFFQTDAAINQGNSGGPIINQKGNQIQFWGQSGTHRATAPSAAATARVAAQVEYLIFQSLLPDQSSPDLI